MTVSVPIPSQEESPKAPIAIGRIYLEYASITGHFDNDKVLVENDVNNLTYKIASTLTHVIGEEFSVGYVEYSEGSVKVSGVILAAWMFITPIIQGYVAKELPGIGPPPVETATSPGEIFANTCTRVETITTQVIEKHQVGNYLQLEKKTIQTKTIDEVCVEWKRKKKF